MGSPEQIAHAEQLVKDVIAEASSGGPGGQGYGPSSGEQIQVKVPNNKVGLIIGRGGETIKSLQSRSGARIQVQNDSETEPGATERIVTLVGNKQATDTAYEMIKEVIDEVHFHGAFVIWFCMNFCDCV
jgi:far upstream element-binding protein